jgi:hypothetical protein
VEGAALPANQPNKPNATSRARITEIENRSSDRIRKPNSNSYRSRIVTVADPVEEQAVLQKMFRHVEFHLKDAL